MNKLLIVIPLLALAACGQPVVKNGDLMTHLKTQGYTKVLLRPGKLNCGQFGQGKNFIGTQKDGTKIMGQICYKKDDGKVNYNVAVNQVLGKGGGPVTVDAKTGTTVPNPWKK